MHIYMYVVYRYIGIMGHPGTVHGIPGHISVRVPHGCNYKLRDAPGPEVGSVQSRCAASPGGGCDKSCQLCSPRKAV